ncbi:MAG: RtcB family protein [Methanomicrobiales archaeon]|nr:RtcB family protein [Methanomicrobiales archaeon]
MRVPGRIYLSEALMSSLEDGAVRQLANVATMPGIVSHALAMPDIHWGYGFPIGGVAAFSMEDGVISPGGVGFDINCGVRLMGTPLVRKDLGDVRGLLEELYRAVPTGVGAKSSLRLSGQALDAMMVQGSSWAEQEGYGLPADIRRCEDAGAMAGADPAAVSQKAKQRGMPQAGTLGAGNHFLEVQEVKEVYDPAAAAAFGVREGQVCVMVHCGSRGLGHQVCTDHLLTLERAVKKYQIALSDRQLACAPLSSPEGKAYYGAMAAAANYAWANRQLIMHNTRDVLRRLYHIPHEEMPLIYDVAHNVAKMEEHEVEGHRVRLCVHRKGATRAFGPGREEVAAEFRETGQPVIIPGSMGTSSFLLKGTAHAMAATFGSTCHGAGRLLSRTAAKKEISGREVTESLARNGIVVKAPHPGAIAEEAPAAYKSSAEVVRVVHESGISLLVARLEPIGVIKG